MPSEESIRTDASTVQRTGASGSNHGDRGPSADGGVVESGQEAVPSSLGSTDPAAGSVGGEQSVGAEQIAQAKTVIRGSSRGERANKSLDPLRGSPAAVAQVLLGQRLNHFLLEELIGGGGMGAVFRAHDEHLDRTVAIKVIPFVGDDPDLQRRFRNEAQSAAKLDHPRIARVFDAGSHGEWHYIVFEYIEGTNVRDLVNRNGVLSIDEAVFYTSQLADALQHAADRGIVHRDIKPSNVLIGPEGKIKLVDMGLARSDSLDLSEDMTASGVTLGTFDYISPEQARDPRDADLRSDLYSLGCTLYFMVTGQPPYPGGTMLQKLLSHGNAPPPDARQLRPEVSENLVAVMQKMLAKNPSDRYQTATDLIADLREVAIRDGLKRSQTLGPVAVREPHPLLAWLEKYSPWVVAASLLLAIAGWLHLESLANRQDIAVPSTARRPTVGPPPEAQRITPDGTEPAERMAVETPSLTLTPTRQDLPPSVAPERRPEGTESSESGETSESNDATKSTELSDPTEAADATSPSPSAEFSGEGDSRGLSPETEASSDVGLDGVDRGGVDRGGVDRGGVDRVGVDRGGADVGAAGLAGADLGTDVLSETTAALRDLEAEEERSVVPLETEFPHVVRLVDEVPNAADPRAADGAALATSLSQAIELAGLFGADRIEIATQTVISQPVRLENDLSIRSTVPGGSTVLFRSLESRSMERSEMFTIGHHQVEFEDLHFVWNVPSRDADGGTLFEVNDNKLVRLTDCTVTVNNPTLHDEVYAFEVETDPDKLSRDRGETIEDYPTVWVELNNVIVRGHMTMLHMDYAAKLMLFWDNGLLAVTGRMVDTAGARRELPTDAEPILLNLTYVTAHAPLGIMRTRVGVSGSHPVPVDRFARKSVFVVDPSLPHFEFFGLASIDDGRPLLHLRGASNAYDVEATRADPMLRLLTSDGEMEITRINDLVVSSPSWADETRPSWEVNWAGSQLPGMPVNERTPTNYLQSDVSPPGFDEKSLPTIPDAVNSGISAMRAARNDTEIVTER